MRVSKTQPRRPFPRQSLSLILLWAYLAPLVLLLASLALLAAPAGAVTQFGSYGTGAGEFIEPNGIAVDQHTGDVYVVDTNNARIEKFTKDGGFLLAWGWGVADGKTQALQTCTTTCFAGARGSGAGQLQFAEGIAVDNDPRSPSYEDVYVVDIENNRVQKFSPTGKFLLMFGGEVNHTADTHHEASNEGICPINPGDQCTAGTQGNGNGQFDFTVEGSFIAVGPNGIVYVGSHNSIEEFSAEGLYQSQIKLLPAPVATGTPEAGGTSGLAINAEGDLYVIRHGTAGIDEYEPSGNLIRNLDNDGEPAYAEGPTPTIAVDPAGDLFVDVHVDERHHVDEYNAAGAKLVSFDYDMADGLHGIAYDERGNALYVVSTSPTTARVRVLTPPPPPPFTSTSSELATLLIPEL
ncbi:MAG TPA: hypothetical protein VK778_11265 [Solirubrobacteraceae bacterium]|jgi:DNA-binding beta-propeller fold protein YncE|nr:hypothetical protein [Solirubrobacteraceae bacterium]